MAEFETGFPNKKGGLNKGRLCKIKQRYRSAGSIYSVPRTSRR